MSRDPSRSRPLLVAATAAAAAAIAVGLIVTTSRDAGTQFTPVADAYVDQTRPGQNFGRSSELRAAAAPGVQRSYIRFQVSGLGAGVGRAMLRLLPNETSGSGFEIFAVDDHAWRETSITYANAPALGARLGVSGPVTGRRWTEIDVSPLVRVNGAVGLAIAKSLGAPVSLSSREASNRPQLVVTGGRSPTTALPTISPTVPSPPPTPTTSASADQEAITVALAGDIACDPGRSSFNGGNGTATECRMKATSDLVRSLGVDAVITLGDNQYEDGAFSKYEKSYDPTWGRFKFKTYPVPGNHDYRTAAGYHRYFGRRAGDPSKGYYSFALGKWHVIVLNSNCDQAGGCGRGSPQEQWLREDLAANARRCTLAAWHHPRFSSGRHGSSARYTAFWQALYDFGADLVIAGHDHDYERFAPQTPSGKADSARGIREFVVGTGGRSHYSFERTEANSEVRNSSAFGVLKLTLSDTAYDWAFAPAPPATFTDSGTGTCH